MESIDAVPGPPDADLDRAVRRSVFRLVVSIVALVLALGAAGLWLEAELFAAAQWVEVHVGLPGLAAIVFLADSITTPVPPDLALVVIAKSALRDEWWWIVPFLGLVSAAGGNVGFFLGAKLGGTRLAERMVGRFRRTHGALIARRGWIGVALGALTPLPFSLTCWFAGMVGMRHSAVAATCLLRVPRFVAFYLIVDHSPMLLRALS